MRIVGRADNRTQVKVMIAIYDRMADLEIYWEIEYSDIRTRRQIITTTMLAPLTDRPLQQVTTGPVPHQCAIRTPRMAAPRTM